MKATSFTVHPALQAIAHQLVVSVQAEAHEPLGNPVALLAMANSVLAGGAKGLRVASIPLLQSLRQQANGLHLPIISLTKNTLSQHTLPPSTLAEQVYITPTPEEAIALLQAGASIVATDATLRPRNHTACLLEEWVQQVKALYPNACLLADVSTVEEGLNAYQLGFNAVATTLSGYTAHTLHTLNGQPDWNLLEALVSQLPAGYPVLLEGRVTMPEQVKKGLNFGAYSIIVGSAITRPHLITQGFSAACIARPRVYCTGVDSRKE